MDRVETWGEHTVERWTDSIHHCVTCNSVFCCLPRFVAEVAAAGWTPCEADAANAVVAACVANLSQSFTLAWVSEHFWVRLEEPGACLYNARSLGIATVTVRRTLP